MKPNPTIDVARRASSALIAGAFVLSLAGCITPSSAPDTASTKPATATPSAITRPTPTKTPTPTPTTSAASTVSLGDLDDLDLDDLDLGDLDLDDLDFGDLDLDLDELKSMPRDELAARLRSLQAHPADPGATDHTVCIAVDPAAIAAIGSGLTSTSIESAAAHLSDDGAWFFVAVTLESGDRAVFAATDNPARTDFDGNVIAVDSLAQSASSWPHAEDTDLGGNITDSGASKVLDCAT